MQQDYFDRKDTEKNAQERAKSRFLTNNIVTRYDNVRDGEPAERVSRFDIYDRIRDNTYQVETEYIQTKHKKGILADWKGRKKGVYQADKRNRAASGLFFG